MIDREPVAKPSWMNVPLLIGTVVAASCALIASEATAHNRCEGETFTVAEAPSGLPAEIDALLRRPIPLEDCGPYHVCVMPDPTLPMRRFGVALIGDHHAFVSIVRLGSLNGVEAWSFDFADGQWAGRQTSVHAASADSMTDLLRVMCNDGP